MRLFGLLGRCDPVAPALHGGEVEAAGRVRIDVAGAERAAVDHLQRLERVSDRGRVETVGGELVDEALHVARLNVCELRAGERRQTKPRCRA